METLFNYGANVIAYLKDNHPYAMCCAWAMEVGDNQFLMLLGGQSDTGNALKVGDIVGVSALSSSQKDIAFACGSNHSSKTNKLKNIPYDIEGNAILIKDAKVRLIARVKNISLVTNDEDHLVQLEVLTSKCDDAKLFLNFNEVE